MPSYFLESERLWFRAPEPEDAELAQGWLNDPRVRTTLTRSFPVSLAIEKKWIEGNYEDMIAMAVLREDYSSDQD